MSESNDTRSTFERIYEARHWEGGSGQGSREDVTGVYRLILDQMLRASDIDSVVDVGCGDWEFSRLVNWHDASYLGVDIVPEVIAANATRFARSGIRFECGDILSASLPSAHLLLCKDVLQHWPSEAIRRFLRASCPRYRYLVVTNDIASVHCPAGALNSEIRVGEWRTLDLERPPFGLRANWRFDYDVRGQWTKRLLLLVNPSYRAIARLRPGSALRLLRRRASPSRPGRA